jgi:hypothetical protein
MRSRTSHAAKSGVGEHTARESESAQCVRRGRACGERPPPNLALEPKGFRAKSFYGIALRRPIRRIRLQVGTRPRLRRQARRRFFLPSSYAGRTFVLFFRRLPARR